MNMAALQGSGGASPARLGDLAHQMRSALSATTAYLDLARERMAEGEAVTAEDLDRVERGLARVAAALGDLEAAAKAAPKEGSR